MSRASCVLDHPGRDFISLAKDSYYTAGFSLCLLFLIKLSKLFILILTWPPILLHATIRFHIIESLVEALIIFRKDFNFVEELILKLASHVSLLCVCSVIRASSMLIDSLLRLSIF